MTVNLQTLNKERLIVSRETYSKSYWKLEPSKMRTPPCKWWPFWPVCRLLFEIHINNVEYSAYKQSKSRVSKIGSTVSNDFHKTKNNLTLHNFTTGASICKFKWLNYQFRRYCANRKRNSKVIYIGITLTPIRQIEKWLYVAYFHHIYLFPVTFYWIPIYSVRGAKFRNIEIILTIVWQIKK